MKYNTERFFALPNVPMLGVYGVYADRTECLGREVNVEELLLQICEKAWRKAIKICKDQKLISVIGSKHANLMIQEMRHYEPVVIA